MQTVIRPAEREDAAAIADIYNQGIAERGSTFETEPRSVDDANAQLGDRRGFPTLVAEDATDHIFYGIPDVLGTSRQRYAWRRVLSC